MLTKFTRRLTPALCFLFALTLPACGGGGGGGGTGSSLLPAAIPTSNPLVVISRSGNAITITGQIVHLIKGGFEVQGGHDVGFLNIYVSSSTVITGPAPFVGEQVQISGTGSPSTSITASSVTQIVTSPSATPSAAPVPTPAATPASTPAPVISPGAFIAIPTGVAAVGGTIVGLSPGKFEINAAHYGYMWVQTNSTTAYINGSPSVGKYALVTGGGTLGVSVNARYVALFGAAPPSTTVSGAIAGSTPYGFTMNAGGGAVPVALTSGTVVLGSLTVGSNVTISGTGSAAVGTIAGSISIAPSGPIATPTPVPSAPPAPSSVPAHVQTADYLWSTAEVSADPAVYAPYLTWAYTKGDRFGITHAAGIKTVLYTNPLMPVPDNSLEFSAITGQYANLQAKDCNGNPVTSYNGSGRLLDVTNPGAPAYVQTVVQGYADQVGAGNPGFSNPIDLVFVDNANSFYGVRPMPCGYSPSDWENGMDTALAGTSYPVLLNTLAVPATQVPAQVAALQGSNVSGGEYEHCFNDGQWTAAEQAQIQAVALLARLGKSSGPRFWCYLDGTNADAAGATAQRLFAYASFLLTYNPDASVFQESYSTPSTFKVMPETQFVPMYAQKTASDISDLQDGGGAYVQRYAYCYYKRSLVGSCEVVVNPGTSSVSIPNASSYSKSMALSGEDILDGGSVTFAAGTPATLAPNSGAILLQ